MCKGWHKQKIMHLLYELNFSFILAKMPRLGARKGGSFAYFSQLQLRNLNPEFYRKVAKVPGQQELELLPIKLSYVAAIAASKLP